MKIEHIKELVLHVWPDDSIRQQIVLTQAVHESNIINGGSRLFNKYNNLFGIKGAGTGGSVSMPTMEHVQGEWIKVYDKFAVYMSAEDSLKAHKELMHKPRYKNVLLAQTPLMGFQALQQAGYATDPKYADRLNIIYKLNIMELFS